MTTPYLSRGVVIACENSPSSVTLSGDKKALNSVVVKITAEQPEVFVRHLKVDMAYHSRKYSVATLQTNNNYHVCCETDDSQIIWKRLVMNTKHY